MQALIKHKGLVIPLNRANIDTDAILPKQYLKSIRKTGYGNWLFDELRYLDQGDITTDNTRRKINHDFVLNQPRYKAGTILLTGENFGCGSSREHAPWALRDFGIRVIIAPSFADIFYNNCCANGLLPIRLEKSLVADIFLQLEAEEGYKLEVDLQLQLLIFPDGGMQHFDIETAHRDQLLSGSDAIALSLKYADEIRRYEHNRRQQVPWQFSE